MPPPDLSDHLIFGTGAGTAGSSSTALPAASLEAGLQLFRRGDFKGAEPHLAGALKQAPRDRRILEALGSIYARTDRWRQAEESFRAALAVEPATTGARLGLAALCIDTGRYDEARTLLLEVRRRDPGNLTARLKGALLDVRLGRTAEAEAGAREAISRQPANAEARVSARHGLFVSIRGIGEGIHAMKQLGARIACHPASATSSSSPSLPRLFIRFSASVSQ